MSESTSTGDAQQEFPEALRAVFAAAGAPSHSRIVRALRGDREGITNFSSASWSGWKSGDQLPEDLSLVKRVVGYLERRVDERGNHRQVSRDSQWWVQCLQRTREARRLRQSTPSLATADDKSEEPVHSGLDMADPSVWWVRELTANLAVTELDIHRAITPGLVVNPDVKLEDQQDNPLPVYIPRSFDVSLSKRLTAATLGNSVMVTLVGGSSTGKTRSCWEALAALPDGWCLWHPIVPSEPEALLAGLKAVGPRTVIWLNEAQHYLLTSNSRLGERAAAQLRDLLRDSRRAPVLVMATLWQEYWNTLTATVQPGNPDPHRQSRDLLRETDVHVPDVFTRQELQALQIAATDDDRLAEASQEAGNGQITQYLAAGPALLQRYRNAEPAAIAVLHAAMDARRLGHGPALPHSLLADAAPGYLTDREWSLVSEEWLEEALSFLVKPVHGAQAPLGRIRPRRSKGPAEPSYHLADYLEQAGRTIRQFAIPPIEFWEASLTYAKSHLVQLGQAAERRGLLRVAAEFYQELASDAARFGSLSRLRMQIADWAGAESMALRAAEADDVNPLRELAIARHRTGDQLEAERLMLIAAERGSSAALIHISQWREEAGDLEGAEEIAIQASRTGDTFTLLYLARRREGAGNHARAESLAELAAKSGSVHVLRELARSRAKAGDVSGAKDLMRRAASYEEDGSTLLLDMADLHELVGDTRTAQEYLQRSVDQGDVSGLHKLAQLHAREGNLKSAEELALRAANLGNVEALEDLALWREEAGDIKGSEELARRAADLGNMYALRQLALTREEVGDSATAEELAMAALDNNDTETLRDLARWRENFGDKASAENLMQRASEAADPDALWELARMRQEAGDRDAAIVYAQRAADAGDTDALRDLARRYELAGDMETAQELMQQSASAGNRFALWDLARRRENSPDKVSSEQRMLRAADAGNTEALLVLSQWREESGDYQGAEELAQRAANAGDIGALRQLVKLRDNTAPRWRARISQRLLAACGHARPRDLSRYGWEPDGSDSGRW